MSPDQIEEIVKDVAPLSLKAALAYLASRKIYDYAGKGYERLKHIIKSKSEEQHYAFVPNKQEATKLKELSRNPNYQTVRSLIPRYPYIDLIRTGLLIRSYITDPANKEKNKERTTQIKGDISRRPNAKKLMSVIHLASTDHFSSVISYLVHLKNSEGYSRSQLLEKFEEIVSEWDGSHLAVHSTFPVAKIKAFCVNKMKEGRRNIFLLGMIEASRRIDDAMRQLEDEKAFSKYRYEAITIKCEGGVEPRVEVTLRYISEVDEFAKAH